VAIAALAATAVGRGSHATGETMPWMHHFMGFFLVMFAALKFFDLPKFADGFQMYDLLGHAFRPYALSYPFIELGLGLGYLAHWRPAVLYPTTLLVMAVSATGVIRALTRGLDVRCACMGNILKVPLSTVTLTEDLAMAAMAGVMWFLRP